MSTFFLKGIQIGIRQWRIAAIVYFLQLCLALTLGMQVYDVLQASIGSSLEINQLLTNYDHTVMADFLKVHGASITPLIGQLRWLLLVWLLFSVFTDGGLLYCTSVAQPATGRSFWQGGATYFFPFLKIALFFLVLALLWTAVVFMPIGMFLEPSLQYFSSEQYSVWLVLLMLGIWLLGFSVLLVWSVLSRLERLKNKERIVTCIQRGWRVFRKNTLRFMLLLAAFAGLQLSLVGLYWLLEAFTGMTSPALIVVVFVSIRVT